MTITEPTPQDRLAISRKAILRHMNRHHREQRDPNTLTDEDSGNDGFEGKAASSSGSFSVLKHALWVWWQRNPASAAVELAQPMLGDYARQHPYKLLGMSAGVGAVMVLARPWRMVSLGAVIAATLKSSGLSHAVFSLLASANGHKGAAEIQPQAMVTVPPMNLS